jgi:hypothetical protein
MRGKKMQWRTEKGHDGEEWGRDKEDIRYTRENAAAAVRDQNLLMAASSWFKLDVWLKACKNSVMGNLVTLKSSPEPCPVRLRPENA